MTEMSGIKHDASRQIIVSESLQNPINGGLGDFRSYITICLDVVLDVPNPYCHSHFLEVRGFDVSFLYGSLLFLVKVSFTLLTVQGKV